MIVRNAEYEDMKQLGHIMAVSFRTAFADFVSQQTMDACAQEDNCAAMLEEALNQISDQPVFLWAFKENKRARRFYEKHGFRWDGSERVSEFDGALEVRYMKG